MRPNISVITVTYNPGISRINKTIQSVLSQSIREKFEYGIIDGKSDDGTVEFLKNQKNYVDFFLSERDNGIYDAMNKGVQNAHGEWILFLNAGDVLYSDDTLNNILNLLIKNPTDCLYGDCIQEYPDYVVYDKAESLDRLPYQMIASHQSMLCKRKLLLEYPFNIQYKVCADFDFICRMYTLNCSFLYYNKPISIVEPIGFSSHNINKNLLEKRAIVTKYFPKQKKRLYFYYTLKIILLPFVALLKKIIPAKLLYIIRKRKYFNASPKDSHT